MSPEEREYIRREVDKRRRDIVGARFQEDRAVLLFHIHMSQKEERTLEERLLDHEKAVDKAEVMALEYGDTLNIPRVPEVNL